MLLSKPTHGHLALTSAFLEFFFFFFFLVCVYLLQMYSGKCLYRQEFSNENIP